MTDRDSAQPGFDPRFDPAFQPGYDPQLHRKESLFSRMPSAAGTFGTATRQDDPPLASGVVSGVGSETRPTAGERPTAVAGFPAEEELAVGEPAPWWRRANPYLLALGALGVIFIATGFALANAAAEGMRTGFSGGPGDDGFFWQMFWQMTLWGAPMLIVLGLATLSSIVVILAARWRPSATR